MIRLTVLYNLPEGSDEEEFLRWRLGEHQQYNSGMPGVLRTDFARVDGSWAPGNIHAQARYRFMTIAEWPDRESFEAAFYDPQTQADLENDSKRIPDCIFLISEILVSSAD